MDIVVQKYGGSSVATVEKMQDIAKRIISLRQKGKGVVVVVSAMGKTTNKLIELAKQASSNPCKRELDVLMSTGEQISISLLSMVFKEYGYDAISLTGIQAGIRTDGFHTKNRIADINIDIIKEHLNNGKIVVVAGFQGVNDTGEITTLGRGGSDTSAVAIACKLKCPCEIYTDIDGIYTLNPKDYKDAKKLKYISYEEMMEMASLGAGVMEPRAVEIGCKYDIPIYVALNNWEEEGTYITREADVKMHMEQQVITGLATIDDVIMVTINDLEYNQKVIASIFDKLAKNNLNIDMISQTSPKNKCINLSFTTSGNDEDLLDEVLNGIKGELINFNFEKEKDITKISVVGIGMRHNSGVASRIFNLFANNDIETELITTSEISISYIINKNKRQEAIQLIAKEFEL